MAVGKGAADPAPVPLHASARPKLSKAQQRKLRQVEKKHASKNVTSVLYAQLEQNALPASAAALLQPASRLGRGAKVSRREAAEWGHAWRRAVGSVAGDDAGEELPSTEAFAPVADVSRRKRRRTEEEDSEEGDPEGGAEDGGLASARREVPSCLSNAQAVPPATPPVRAVQDAEAEDDVPASDAAPLDKDEMRRLVALAKGDGDAAAQPIGRPSSRILASGKPLAVSFPRTAKLSVERAGLPAFAMEQELTEAISNNPCVFVEGATGSGKTTQVPQFLLEAGFGDARHPHFAGCVLVTQPRRVAAVSAAARVAEELGVSLGGPEVGYAVRHESRVQYARGPSESRAQFATKLVFVTDGVLLRQLLSDFHLEWASCVIVDEAHERSVTSDLILGLLTRCVRSRNAARPDRPLHLVVMSATLDRALLGQAAEVEPKDADDGDHLARRQMDAALGPRVNSPALLPANLLGETSSPPVISIPARRFKVTVHFSRRTSGHDVNSDFVDDVIAKTVKLHKRLPPGAMLVFVTGQNEVDRVLAALRDQVGAEDPSVLLHGSTGGERTAAADAPGGMCVGDETDGDDPGEVHNISASAPTRSVMLPKIKRGRLAEPRQSSAEFDDFDELEEEAEASDEEEVEVIPGDDDDEADDGDDKADAMLRVARVGRGGRTAGANATPPSRCYAAPLYAALPMEKQRAAFEMARLCESPELGARAIVVATNVAETSITVPGVRYVVDCGREKVRTQASSTQNAPKHGSRMVLDESLASPSVLSVVWCSQASAMQRAGRAGRVCAGHCYRLFSSAVYQRDFPEAKRPNTESEDLAPAVLTLKALGVASVRRFPWITPPHASRLHGALRVLASLGALTPPSRSAASVTAARFDELDDVGKFAVSSLGRAMADFALPPRVSACLFFAVGLLNVGPLKADPLVRKWQADRNVKSQASRKQYKAAVAVLAWMLSACAVLSTERATILLALPAASEGNDSSAIAREQRKAWAKATKSSLLCDACALCAFERAGAKDARRKLCATLFLDPRACEEAAKARRQAARVLGRLLLQSGADEDVVSEVSRMEQAPPRADAPTPMEGELARLALSCGYGDCIATRVSSERREAFVREAEERGLALPNAAEVFEFAGGEGLGSLATLPKGIVGKAISKSQPQQLLFVRLEGGMCGDGDLHRTGGGSAPQKIKYPLLLGATVV